MTIKIGIRSGRGCIYRLCPDGAIYLRKTYKFVGFLNDRIEIEKGLSLYNKELDNYILDKLKTNESK